MREISKVIENDESKVVPTNESTAGVGDELVSIKENKNVSNLENSWGSQQD